MKLKDEIFESHGVGWVLIADEWSISPSGKPAVSIGYAICLTKKCHETLDFKDGRVTSCRVCGRKYSIDRDFEVIKSEVDRRYEASKTWDAEVINLDLLPTKVTAIDKDENYKIIAKLGQQNGKRTAVVYILDRNETRGEKAQFFIDVDDELIRFDRDDKHPMQLLAKNEAEFLNSKHRFENKADKLPKRVKPAKQSVRK
jgi:hypothetical protein